MRSRFSAGARFQAIVETEWDSAETLRDVTCQARFADGARRVVEEVGAVAHPGVYRIAWEMTGWVRSNLVAPNDSDVTSANTVDGVMR